MSDDAKEEALTAFSEGQIKRLVVKPKIGAWGLNWQHCHNVISFPSHSFESHYQGVRRCWRFGQQNPVSVHLIVNEGEVGVLKNLERKTEQAKRMFSALVKHMHDSLSIEDCQEFNQVAKIPTWLQGETICQ